MPLVEQTLSPDSAFALSKRRLVEELFRRTSELQTTLDAVHEEVLVLGPLGGVRHVSRRFHDVLGESDLPQEGMVWDELKLLIEQAFPEAKLPTTFSFPRAVDELSLGVLSSTETKRIELRSFALGDVPGTEGVVWTFGNQSSRLRKEESADRAEHSSRCAEITRDLAHDFNNVLQGIHAACDVLLVENQFSTTVVSELQGICEATDRAASLIRQITSLNHEESPKRRIVGSPEALAQHGGAAIAGGKPGAGMAGHNSVSTSGSLANCPAAPLSSTEMLQRPSGTILLVESDEGVRQQVNLSLRVAGYHVIEAPDAGHAVTVASLHSGEIDLLILSAHVGDGGAAVLHEELRRIWPRLPIIVTSVSPETISLDASSEAQVALLQTPISTARLHSQVEDLLQGPLATREQR